MLLLKLRKNEALIAEVGAATLTVLGMYLGSSTSYGAFCYLAGLVFWFRLMFLKRLWGLLPLNIATLGVSSYHLWRTF